jgi:hypothetical protein
MRYGFFLCALALLLVTAGAAVALDGSGDAAAVQETELNGPAPQGQPSAVEQVESWINENVSPEDRAERILPESSSVEPLGGLVRETEHATVDWGAGRITATGVAEVSDDGYNPARAEAMAMRKATLEARKWLHDAVFALPLDGRRQLAEELTPAQKNQLRGQLQNSPIERTTEPDDAGGVLVRVRAEARLRGDLANALMPSSIAFQSRIPPKVRFTGVEWSMSEPRPLEELEYQRSMAELGAFTGLIVDARGLDGAPALLPVIFGPEGRGVFGPFLAPRSVVLDKGLVVYAKESTDEAARQRCGGTPLEVRAVAMAGPQQADVVVSAPDAELIELLFHSQGVRENCPVAILLD